MYEGGGEVRESKNCHYRFSIHEENIGFLTDDGIEIFLPGTRFQKALTCGHTEFPVESDSVLCPSLIERRRDSRLPKSLYVNLMNL